MTTYNISASTCVTSTCVATVTATLLRLSFGAPAQNDMIVRDAVAAIEGCELEGGALVLLNGPASLPVACAIAHAIAHRFGAVGVFDPKLAAYVVAISHDPELAVGDLIPAADVVEES